MYNVLKSLREEAKKKARKHDTKKPVAYWREKDYLDGNTVDVFVGILRTRGCYWALVGGCTMCGYIRDAYMAEVSISDLKNQIKILEENYSGEPYVKIFTSGSFLDTGEIPVDLYEDVFAAFSDARVISIESRPELITEDALLKIRGFSEKYNTKIEISIGLESSNEQILKKLINKGFSIEDYVRSATLARKLGFLVKTYVLLKPPFVSEYYALKTGINSSLFAANFSDRVSINPTVIQPYTIAEDLYKMGLYNPPWVFTLIVLLKTIKLKRPEKIFVSYPMKKMKKGGLRGCESCLEVGINSIIDFSLTQNHEKLKIIKDCECYKEWVKEMLLSRVYPYLY